MYAWLHCCYGCIGILKKKENFVLLLSLLQTKTLGHVHIFFNSPNKYNKKLLPISQHYSQKHIERKNRIMRGGNYTHDIA